MSITVQDVFYYYLNEVRKSEIFQFKDEEEQQRIAAILTEWTVRKVNDGNGNPHM